MRVSARARGRDRHPDRAVWRSAAVLGLAVTATGLALIGGLGFLLVGTGHAVGAATNDFSDSFFLFDVGPTRPPVPVPAAACPYVRLVATASERASAPWLETFGRAPDWTEFSHELSAPLADLDAALGAAIPHLPASAAVEFTISRNAVEMGRAQLLTAHSLQEYRDGAVVGDGSFGLNQSAALAGHECGPD